MGNALSCFPRDGISELIKVLELDFDLDAGRQLQGHQGFHRLLGGADDVDEALVGQALELLTAVLVLVDGAQNRDDLSLRRQRNWAGTFASVRLAVSTMSAAA